jgi:hypothetical protein
MTDFKKIMTNHKIFVTNSEKKIKFVIDFTKYDDEKRMQFHNKFIYRIEYLRPKLDRR